MSVLGPELMYKYNGVMLATIARPHVAVGGIATH
jgi:hypothetical protein